MKNDGNESNDENHEMRRPDTTRVVYVLPSDATGLPVQDELDLRKLWNLLYGSRFFIASVITIFAVVAVGYSLLATEWYRATILLAPADTSTSADLGGQLSGLAALAGVSTSAKSDSGEAIAVLESRDLARSFIEDFGLLPVLLWNDWDRDKLQWRSDNKEDWPDTRDAIEFFHRNVLNVSLDPQTSLVTLTIDWTDPIVAANWAAELVRRVNVKVRERALREAEANVTYLQQEMEKSGVVSLQQSVGRLLEAELQKLMLARGKDEFVFRIIDAAEPPRYPIRPRRVLIAAVSTLIGAVVGIFTVLIRQYFRGVHEGPVTS